MFKITNYVKNKNNGKQVDQMNFNYCNNTTRNRRTFFLTTYLKNGNKKYELLGGIYVVYIYIAMAPTTRESIIFFFGAYVMCSDYNFEVVKGILIARHKLYRSEC